MSQESLLELIKEYLQDVDIFMSLLRKKIGDNHPLASARHGLIQKEGLLEGIKYNFHGKGCRFEKSGRTIEFDFGSGLNHEGFDLWRLGIYAHSRESDFPQYQDQKVLSDDFNSAIREGLIFKSKDELDSNFYLIPNFKK
ncbi:MAG: hypothetical protein LAT68_17155 [Cyclobacteriaceae bacterium]|nr:hypothetical protein [Cyclobacteriaceae bacterium]